MNLRFQTSTDSERNSLVRNNEKAEDDDEDVEDISPDVVVAVVTLLLGAIGKGATAFIGAIGAASNEREGKKSNRNHELVKGRKKI